MRATKRLMQTAGVAAGAIGVVAASAPESRVGRTARRLVDGLARNSRYMVSSAPGIVYRLTGRSPDPDVADDILADRIRSSLGPLEKRLDVPHVHVMVYDHVAILHGEVPDDRSAMAIEYAAMRVSGVKGVESHLHAGLAPGDTRPSEGALARPPSAALYALLEAARAAGARDDAPQAVHAVLRAFADRLPDGEREQVLAHLPADVRALLGLVRRHGERPTRLKTVPQLVAAVIAQGDVEPRHAEDVTRAVVAALRDLVPEEAADVAAVLPVELRGLWEPEPAR